MGTLAVNTETSTMQSEQDGNMDCVGGKNISTNIYNNSQYS